MEDLEIIDLYWAREEQAIVESQNKYGNYCFSIAINILNNKEDSDECVNDTWMRAWNAMPPTKPDRLSLFFAAITRNLSFDRWKRRKAKKRGSGQLEVALDELMECIPAVGSTEQEAEAAELERLLNDFLHTLPERECNVFLRRYWYVEPVESIALRYGMNRNTVKTSLFRSRKKLKEYLENEGIVV